MKKINLFLVTLIAIGTISISSYAAMTIDWSNTAADIVVADAMRHIAYNPKTNHMLIANSENLAVRGITIIDANNGTVLGSLATTATTWDGNVPSPYGVGVDADGVIYVTKGFYSSTSPVEILRWADETSLPTSCVTTDANMVRSLYVVGKGVNTQLVISAQGDEIVRIYGTTDGINFIEYGRFNAPDAIHDAISSSALDTVYVTRAFNGPSAASTHQWINSGGTWSENGSWTQSGWISSLALSESANTLYGAIWDMGQSTITEGIRAWNAKTGVQTDTLDIGETGAVSVRGCYIALGENKTVSVAPKSISASPGQTKSLSATADLARKLYFAFCGGFGFGRIDTGAVISGPVWSSNNYTVASVDNTGVVHLLTVGVCTVSATFTREAVPFTDSAVVTVVATSAPLAPDATSYTSVHRVEHVAEISTPRMTRSWELFQ
jgi:hypothetical protein